ncbi:DUF2004 domain-containing protein [Brucepastera parasyntrophica]|uniref:DUF2004 domain-containing protein n=1 Tax=Brucepastera parasyntrophica TaxID=2880008 RepID=UPI002108A59B|nr:DUF2004 domain-containing protein [Brucepastera parasyntrophica]ULQ59052.1 DUF2004 domain-containing protein [Brucepastera parasyntrophica]
MTYISLSDCNLYGEKLKLCLEIIDKYPELVRAAKKAIADNFPGNETVRYYFECHFDLLDDEDLLEIFGVKTFAEFDIQKAIEKLGCPDLLFGIEDGEIHFSADYMISKEYSDGILCVKMDERLNVTGFSQES